MRVAIDVNPMFRSTGGIGSYTFHLVRHLVRLDRENQFFLYNTATREEGREGLCLPANARVLNFQRFLSGWRVKRDRIDVYHGTSYKLWAEGRAGGVVTIHDLAMARFPQFTKRLLGERRAGQKTRRTLERAAKVIAVSENTARDLREFYGLSTKKIAVIHLGVGEGFSPCPDGERIESVKKKYGVLTSEYILYIGGGGPRKNLKRLLQAFSMLQGKGDSLTLLLGGTLGKSQLEVRQWLGDLGLHERAVLSGPIPQVELPVLYSGARLFVYPSLYEGFGLPVLEAMACGAPVMTSNVSSLPEVAGDAAWLVDPYDVRSMAGAMEELLGDPGRCEALRQKGVKRAKEFSWDRTALKTLEVYKEIADL